LRALSNEFGPEIPTARWRITDGLAKSFSGVQQARLDAHRASWPQPSSWTSAHAQGLFSATILMLVAFDGFTLSLA
jgi:hypothetical protein